jgi:hypothetical protein
LSVGLHSMKRQDISGPCVNIYDRNPKADKH